MTSTSTAGWSTWSSSARRPRTARYGPPQRHARRLRRALAPPDQGLRRRRRLPPSPATRPCSTRLVGPPGSRRWRPGRRHRRPRLRAMSRTGSAALPARATLPGSRRRLDLRIERQREVGPAWPRPAEAVSIGSSQVIGLLAPRSSLPVRSRAGRSRSVRLRIAPSGAASVRVGEHRLRRRAPRPADALEHARRSARGRRGYSVSPRTRRAGDWYCRFSTPGPDQRHVRRGDAREAAPVPATISLNRRAPSPTSRDHQQRPRRRPTGGTLGPIRDTAATGDRHPERVVSLANGGHAVIVLE